MTSEIPPEDSDTIPPGTKRRIATRRFLDWNPTIVSHGRFSPDIARVGTHLVFGSLRLTEPPPVPEPRDVIEEFDSLPLGEKIRLREIYDDRRKNRPRYYVYGGHHVPYNECTVWLVRTIPLTGIRWKDQVYRLASGAPTRDAATRYIRMLGL